MFYIYACKANKAQPVCVCACALTAYYIVCCCWSDVTAQCTAPRPLRSRDPGQTLMMSSGCLPALYSGVHGLHQATVYSLSGERESCLAIPKFLRESVQSHFFPLLLPEHTFTSAGTLLIPPDFFLFAQLLVEIIRPRLPKTRFG